MCRGWERIHVVGVGAGGTVDFEVGTAAFAEESLGAGDGVVLGEGGCGGEEEEVGSMVGVF